jgi:acyl-CoA synthetase (AMP-forming)/AMP-acid ligase II
MQTTMMDMPLSLNGLLERAGTLFRDSEIVSRLPDKSLRRHSHGEWHRRTRALASALQRMGLQKGERVATLCWNHHAHLEAFFGIPAAGASEAERFRRAAMAGVPVPLVEVRLRTGDVATMDQLGFVRITDRTKDLIKSGGEWISSVALENALMAHPAVAEAAVIAIPDEKWGERPLACVVFKPGQQSDRAAHVDRQVLEDEAARAVSAVMALRPQV